MSVPNPFVSSGSCYFAPGQEVQEWLPCGNAELGDKTCCSRGDMCLSSKACYNQRFGITYLAGCSDPEYRHSSCPDKGAYRDQPWAGLVYCNGTSEQWVACKQSARPTTLTSADACWCPQTSRTVAFTDASVLDDVVRLPTALGGSVIWQPGYVPMPTQLDTAPTPTSEPLSNPTTTTAKVSTPRTSSASQATETDATEPITDTGMATSTKVGVGVGVGVGCMVLLGVLVYLFFAQRKMQRQYEERENSTENGKPYGDMRHIGALAEARTHAARPFSTMTELDGTPRPMSEKQHEYRESQYSQSYAAWTANQDAGRPGVRYESRSGPIAELPG
ncbi:hypothetical protein CCHL11_00154 [Colletotrichum chlorophyti]|uniref:Uncharacterized protein n=1 Tax=Colletotrichum chlorophyti TaxID=708187 RepID=A0A1Q8RUT1_9PEZI|nr:hypothetical protein CCHL11_00154 [Colletotrichum chlorophyti]